MRSVCDFQERNVLLGSNGLPDYGLLGIFSATGRAEAVKILADVMPAEEADLWRT
jgi:hypothetical protein